MTDTLDSTPSPDELIEDDRPRFIVAIEAYEEYKNARYTPDVDPEAAMNDFLELTRVCAPLVQGSQDYEFASTTESLANTAIVEMSGRKLAEALLDDRIPAEVRQIYEHLYGDEVRQYLPSPPEQA